MKLEPTTKTALGAVAVILFMGSMAWAAVPFYSWFCRVTGFGGVTSTAEAGSDTVLDETITVRFDSNLDRDMPWEFRPKVREMELKIGETGLAFYEAYNPTDHPVAGQATYNVAPYEAGGFFTKIDCFCFTEQVLQPGERVDMPVTFYVDPEITTDRDAKFVKHITLSYTFYEIDLPQEQASLTGGAESPAAAATDIN
ncbi:cytochrome c oxidase assembly protein [Mesobaculum littorinae]|uniref:Cytochrome c oxidase assembly protein CtaG n=1 Tax=Mesobaculum littorinae TaxID=2486419 RepID=A0A438AIT6_9RHOB|nr:cytochrome c oxidase assembly protein [Mesobaculum littorinae]RVV98535.1 cytochrome c oxidase assembly protein [Mesobaculum littorinae]